MKLSSPSISRCPCSTGLMYQNFCPSMYDLMFSISQLLVGTIRGRKPIFWKVCRKRKFLCSCFWLSFDRKSWDLFHTVTKTILNEPFQKSCHERYRIFFGEFDERMVFFLESQFGYDNDGPNFWRFLMDPIIP